MRIVRALAAGGGPSCLAELRLADNRLRVSSNPDLTLTLPLLPPLLLS